MTISTIVLAITGIFGGGGGGGGGGDSPPKDERVLKKNTVKQVSRYAQKTQITQKDLFGYKY